MRNWCASVRMFSSAALGTVLGLAGVAQAQTPEPSGVTIAAHSELISVPVIVTDNSGSHVSNLKKEDFRVLEEGREQRIAVFEEMRPANEIAQRQSIPSGEYRNVEASDLSLRQLVVVVLDMVNTPVTDQVYAKDELSKFLSDPAHQSSPISLLTLNRDGVHLIHHFRDDPKQLLAALNRVQRSQQAVREDPSWAMLPQSKDKESTILESFGQFQINSEQSALSIERRTIITLTLQSMQQVARAVAGMPGRKILVWASAGFPFAINETSMALKEGGTGLDTPADLVPLYERTWAALNQAQLSIYPVDVRGLVNLPGPAPVPVLKEHPDPFLHGQWLQQNINGTFETFARATAGRVFHNRNGLEDALQQANDDSASYYLLGYYLDRTDKKTGWRKLTVSVQKDGAHVLARTGFFFNSRGPGELNISQDEMQVALDSPLDYTAIPITARWGDVIATTEPNKKRAVFTLTMPPSFAEVDEADRNHFAVDFWAAARSAAGVPAGDVEQTMEGHFKPETLERFRSKGTDYRGALTVLPGEYKVRFVVRDRLSGRIGSVSAPLKVAQ